MDLEREAQPADPTVADSGARAETKSELEKILHFPRGLPSRQLHLEEQRVVELFRQLSNISNSSFTVQSNCQVFLDQHFSILQDYK